jgi:hypothetical protein
MLFLVEAANTPLPPDSSISGNEAYFVSGVVFAAAALGLATYICTTRS